MHACDFRSQFGWLHIEECNGSVAKIAWAENGREEETDNIVLKEAVRELKEYFAEERKNFDLPAAPCGTAFQKAVWKEVSKIPYGCTCSYQEIAERIGKPQAVRATASAIARNPIVIVIPCHRVVRSDGRIGNYVNGIRSKEELLKLEGAL